MNFVTLSDLDLVVSTPTTQARELEHDVDRLAAETRDWQSKWGRGVWAVWDRTKGSPGLVPLRASAVVIRQRAQAANIADQDRIEILARLDRLQAAMKSGDISLVVAGAVAYLGYRILIGVSEGTGRALSRKIRRTIRDWGW